MPNILSPSENLSFYVWLILYRMRGRYFLYNSNSSDYMQVIQTTCGVLQSKNVWLFPPHHLSFSQWGFLMHLGFRQKAQLSGKHQCWFFFSALEVGPDSSLVSSCIWVLLQDSYAQRAAAAESLHLGNPQWGKSVSLSSLSYQSSRGARSALDTSAVLKWPRISTHRYYKISYGILYSLFTDCLEVTLEDKV